MALQGESGDLQDNDPSEEDEDDIDRLLNVGSKSSPSRPSTLIDSSSSSNSYNEKTPVESLEHTSRPLIPVRSKVGAARWFMKHKKSFSLHHNLPNHDS